jgi:cell division septal protein FtsQ
MPHDILASSRRKRRKKSILKLSLFLAGILVFLGGLVGLLYIPKFRIAEISIEGINALDKEELKAEITNFLKGKFFKILPYDNIFLLSKAKITALLLQEFPNLKEISIKRNFSRKLSVLTEERKAEALWCVNSLATSTDSGEAECAFVDENGFIFQPAPSFSGGIFLKFFDEREKLASTSENLGGLPNVGEEMIAASEFKKLFSFSGFLLQNNMDVSRIVLKDNGEYEIDLKEGWRILLNGKNEAGLSFNNLKLVLDSNVKEKRSQLEYIDLRFGNKVFFKYK